MKPDIENRKGNAVTELILIMPMILLILILLWHYFQKTTERRIERIAYHYDFKQKRVQTMQQHPLLNRPCLIHSKICVGRK